MFVKLMNVLKDGTACENAGGNEKAKEKYN